MVNKEPKVIYRDKYLILESEWIESTGRDIEILIARPILNAKSKEETPGVLWLHGGGYMQGTARMFFITRAIDLVKKYGAVVVTPEYRLSKEMPYPAALEDAYSALKYLKEHEKELDYNPDQIMVGGESAGGGLTAGLCMYARDKGEINIAFQMPLYPMLDSEDTETSRNNTAPIWNTKKNHRAWKMYLGELYGKEVPPYASPSRQIDYSNLPPAYTFVGDLEPFYKETVTFIENLNKAGVEASVDVYTNCFHAFDMILPFKEISKVAIMKFEEEFVKATKTYFAKQNK